MFETRWIDWLIALFSLVTFLPLLVAQLFLLIDPQGQRAKDIIIGKGETWRDDSHFRSAYAFAWADLLFVLPLLVSGNVGVLLGQVWGYGMWMALGAVSIYFSIVFWVMEKKYTYPFCGPLAYYTYFWGFFLYWGVAAIAYSVYRLPI